MEIFREDLIPTCIFLIIKMYSSPPLSIRVTEIGEYIRYRSCERRFKLEYNNRAIASELLFAERLFNTIDPVLQEAGKQRENSWELSLQNRGLTDLTNFSAHPEPVSTVWSEFATSLSSVPVGNSAYGREISLHANLGAFGINGQLDFIVVLWNGSQPRLRIVECKASRRDRTYHRIQVTLYRMMLGRILESHPLLIGGYRITQQDVECVIARIQEDNNLSQDILALPALNLETEEADIRRLISAGGNLERIVNSNLADLDYQIESKCDDCVFSVHCLTESARERRLELLGLEPSVIRSLRNAGINRIDDLADLNLTGTQATTLRQDAGFSGNLELMRIQAQARRKTLPGGDTLPDEYEVNSLPNTGQGQLPEHETPDGRRLIRVYLSIEYDYVENRIGALAAHVTNSSWQLHTGWLDGELNPETGHVRRVPNPIVQERNEIGRDANTRPIYEERPLQSQDVIYFKNDPWSGDYVTDTSAERTLIQSFLSDLVDKIAEVAEVSEAPIHYYIWSRSDLGQLVEGCSRASSRLLASLRELLGCRDSLEQLIYSCLQEEIDQRFALGWTSRGLSVVASLKWFGNTYHWQRRVSGQSTPLHQEFTQDIFDFKTDLWIDPSVPAWTMEGNGIRHKFEIRSRFHDSLSAPYWRAFWRTLPDPTDVQDARVRRAINSYNHAQRPNNLREYLRARVHALRWVEERIRFKNREISKPSLVIADLPDFNLGVNDTARAALDFLKLDQHIKLTSWIAEHLVPPLYRISTGKMIPVENVISQGQGLLSATLALTGFDINFEAFRNNCNLSVGAFVRLSPFSDPNRGQTFRQLTAGGITCTLRDFNWDTGEISLSVVPFPRSDLYRLGSRQPDLGTVFDRATLDESPSDFVAPRVDNRLQSITNSHVYQWFHPEQAQIPAQENIDPADMNQYREVLRNLRLQGGRQLAEEQRNAVIEGLATRIQLLQGPPGTGKTETTAAATLLRILARRRVRAEGRKQLGDIILIAAHTHTAVNNLLQRIDRVLPFFVNAVSHVGLTMPYVHLSKVNAKDEELPLLGPNIHSFPTKSCLRRIQELRNGSVLIIGGTTSAILKMTQELESKSTFKGFPVSTLIVDEASMMVFPHFLALATIVSPDGEIMLTGDHRQLSPIMAHDWENEDRPPVVAYQPYVSAYQAILNIKQNLGVPDSQILCSGLSFTFRLPPLIRELVARLYVQDGIHLTGPTRNSSRTTPSATNWERLWSDSTGLYLVLHSERQSRKNNPTEVAVIRHILEAHHTQIPEGSVAIVTPHRAQRTLLTSELEDYQNVVDVIDTVERLQGGERPTVIVSATASDPSAISKNVEFILNLNRSNVAFSRAQERLIVVCSSSLLDHIPADLEHYEAALLWKALREICSQEVAHETVNGHSVQIFTPPDTIPEAIVGGEL